MADRARRPQPPEPPPARRRSRAADRRDRLGARRAGRLPLGDFLFFLGYVGRRDRRATRSGRSIAADEQARLDRGRLRRTGGVGGRGGGPAGRRRGGRSGPARPAPRRDLDPGPGPARRAPGRRIRTPRAAAAVPLPRRSGGAAIIAMRGGRVVLGRPRHDRAPPTGLRILYLVNGFPWPLTSGYLRHYHMIRELSRAGSPDQPAGDRPGRLRAGRPGRTSSRSPSGS